MDWGTAIEIFGCVTAGGFLFKAIDRIRFKKEDKTIKKDEVAKAELETDDKQIDLGNKFLETTKKWSEIMESNIDRMMAKMDESNTKRDKDWRILRMDIETIKTDITEIKHRQDLEEEFLNGKYADFLREKGETVGKNKSNGKKKTIPMPRRKTASRNVRNVRSGEPDKGQMAGHQQKADTCEVSAC